VQHNLHYAEHEQNCTVDRAKATNHHPEIHCGEEFFHNAVVLFFEDCNLPLITNRPVITLLYKQRLFERAQDAAL
jgi:hypothetical protein